MPISVTDPTDATAMSWSFLATQFATMRTWVNAVPNGDVVDGSVEGEHLVKPVLQGFPVQAQRSGFREYRHQSTADQPAPLYLFDAWAFPERITILPEGANGDTLWMTPIGATMQAPSTEVRVWFSCAYQVRMDPQLWTPAGALVEPVKAGELQIWGTNRALNLEFVASHATVDLYSNEVSSGDPTSGSALLGAGGRTLMSRIDSFALFSTVVDDVFVVFKRTRANVDQVDLARVSLQIEVF